jgi:hypothetical protein
VPEGRAAALFAAWRALQPAGMLATGEAIGSTYAFTGEGIGKAMETGLLAADALLAHARPATRRCAPATKPRCKPAAAFRPVREGQRVNHHPWLADLVIWRAASSPRILRRMSRRAGRDAATRATCCRWRGITKLF